MRKIMPNFEELQIKIFCLVLFISLFFLTVWVPTKVRKRRNCCVFEFQAPKLKKFFKKGDSLIFLFFQPFFFFKLFYFHLQSIQMSLPDDQINISSGFQSKKNGKTALLGLARQGRGVAFFHLFFVKKQLEMFTWSSGRLIWTDWR